jgi:hypothetical protein
MGRDKQLYGVDYNTSKTFKARVEQAKAGGTPVVSGSCSKCGKTDTRFSLPEPTYTTGIGHEKRDAVCLNCGEVTTITFGLVD